MAVPLFPEWFGLGSVTPFPQLVAFRPQGLVAVAVLATALTVWKPIRLAGIVMLVPILLAAGITAPRVLSRPDPAPAGSTTLTVMAANVLGGGADPDRVAQLIRERRPGFVSLPEARTELRDAILARVADLGYRGFTDEPAGAPVNATTVLVGPGLGDVTVRTGGAGTRLGTVTVTGGTLGELRLIGYHAHPPLPGTVGAWKHDLEALRRWCSEPAPAVIAGDFNSTLDQAAFRHALGDCTSVAAAVGNGLAGTWPAHRPAMLRAQIDHVVVTAGLAGLGFTTYEIEGSDHRAVVATVGVP